MRFHRRCAIIPLLTLLVGCSQEVVVWRGTTTLGDSAVTFASATTMRMVGRTREVCVSPIDSMAGNRPIQLDVYLVRMNGTRERMGWYPAMRYTDRTSTVLTVFPDSMRMASHDTVITIPSKPPTMRQRDGDWCAEEWGSPQMLSRYKAIELRSVARLPITRVRWLSQTPFGL